MLAKMGVVKAGVFWEASVDVGPTMRDRSANADFFACLSTLDVCSKAYRSPRVFLVLVLLEVPCVVNLLVFWSEIERT